MRFENRSPSRLSNSDERRANPSPPTAMPSSSPTRPPSDHQSTTPPAARTCMAAITPSIISLPIHRTASGMNERSARSVRIATVYPRCVWYTSLRSGGTYLRACSRSDQSGGLPSGPESRLLALGTIPWGMKRGEAVTLLEYKGADYHDDLETRLR